MPAKHYHHGDLKQQLVSKGLQLLARDGYQGFSMRKLAAMCGVSHAAPYKHFKNRDEIIRAVSEHIASEFGAALHEEEVVHPGDARAQLVGMCIRYVLFMSDNPDYFRYVFMTDHRRAIEIKAGEVQAEGRLPLEAALSCAKRYFLPKSGEDWPQDFLALWSMTHGLTLALVAGTVKSDASTEDLARSVVERYLMGK